MAEFISSTRTALQALASAVVNRLRFDSLDTLTQEQMLIARLNASAAPSEGVMYYDRADSAGIQQIWRANLDNSNPLQLTYGNAYHSWWPKQSPDGSQVLLLRTPVVGGQSYDTLFTSFQIWMMNADGSGLISILTPATLGAGAAIITPGWHPNGERILFTGGNPVLLKTMRPDGTDIQTITVTGVASGMGDSHYAGDGERVLFCYLSNIYLVSALGGTATALTTDGNTAVNGDGSIRRYFDPAPDPTGTVVAMLVQTGAITGPKPVGEWSIYLVPITGGAQTVVINDGNVNSKPCWGPDGRLYFHRLDYAGVGAFNLASIRVDGGGLRMLSSIVVRHGYPNVKILPFRSAVSFDQQSLTTAQKSQARSNIGAPSVSERVIHLTNASYSIPVGAKWLDIETYGPGAPGGAGRRGAAGSVRNGGTAGGAGGYSRVTVRVADLSGNPLTVVTSAGGIGGVAQTTNDSNGAAGGAPSQPLTYVADGADILCRATCGSPGAGGGTGAGSGGSGGVGQSLGGAGALPSATGLVGVAGAFAPFATGGGSGGGLSAADAQSAGGAGGVVGQWAHDANAGGIAGGGAGTAGATNGNGIHDRGGQGGAGGGSNLTGAGGAGGAGGKWGAGGGGGGASVNGNNSGPGGAGGAGCAIITAIF